MNNDQQMNNNQPSREELDAATALLEQRRQAAQHYQEAQRARTNETNGTPDVDQTGDRTGQETPNGRAQQPDTHETDRQKDSSFLLRAAQLAQEKGNAKEAKALLRSLATLFPEPSVPKQTPPETPGALPSGEGETPAQVEQEPKPRQDETKKSVSLITLTFLAEGRTTSTLTLALKKPTTAATDTATQGPEVATVLNNDPDKTSTKTITEHQETTAIPTNRQGSREEKITEVNIKREDMGTKTDQEAEPAVINPHRDRDRTRQEVGSVLSRSLPVHPTTPPLFKLPTAILH
ncbi:hypothetical protein PSHT_05134, partial [Puccinia striiformis]